jgi:hypothetical protein
MSCHDKISYFSDDLFRLKTAIMASEVEMELECSNPHCAKRIRELEEELNRYLLEIKYLCVGVASSLQIVLGDCIKAISCKVQEVHAVRVWCLRGV